MKKKGKNRVEQICNDLISGDRRVLSKLISMVEDGEKPAFEVLEKIYPYCGKAHLIGITGPPGAGKSTILDGLVSHIREVEKKTVGIIAVDPSSPFTGGAVLGDRVRMQRHFSDAGVFIRSLGNRGYRGGISFSTRLLTKLYEAFGFDYVIIETVGVGQSEIDVMEIADTTVVVLVPESGDTIQTMKAGLLEIADIFAVNKSDREGASAIAEELKQMVKLDSGREGWKVPVIMTSAEKSRGIQELFSHICEHKKHLLVEKQYLEKRSVVKRRELVEVSLASVKKRIEELIKDDKKLAYRLRDPGSNPFTMARQVLDIINGKLSRGNKS